VTMNLFKRNISCLVDGSKSSFLHAFSMMCNNTFVGIFLYMFDMSSDASLRSGVHGMFSKSFISCTEF
jgi:hypothetical protein